MKVLNIRGVGSTGYSGGQTKSGENKCKKQLNLKCLRNQLIRGVTIMQGNRLTLILLAIFFFGAVFVFPQDVRAENIWKEAGIGVGSVLSSIIYSPVKVTYALLGGITGGAAYIFSGFNSRVANNVWNTSLGGDYIITPDILRGKKPLCFTGTTLHAG